MPTEPRCSICTDASARTAVAELRAKNVPLRSIASRLNLAKSSVARHVKHANISANGSTRAHAPKSSHAGRVAAGRCPTCGISADDPDPKALIRRAERALHFGESIVMRAVEEKDDRLALQGLDRVRTTLEQLLKVHGLLTTDGAVQISIDNRRQVAAKLDGFSIDDLRRVLATRETVAEAVETVESTPKPRSENQRALAP